MKSVTVDYHFTLRKNVALKSAGWLAIAKNNLDQTTDCEAFTTASAGKKWCAQKVGRSRLTWEDSAHDIKTDKPTTFRCDYRGRMKVEG